MIGTVPITPLFNRMLTMVYQRINRFPESSSVSAELAALADIWREKKKELEDDGAFKEFIKKLQREWAIETGIIERLYTWDRGVTEVLITQGIESALISHYGGLSQGEADHVRDLIGDQLEIVEGLFGYVKQEDALTEHFIRSLQARFTAHEEYTEARTNDGKLIRVPLLRGEYKKLPNNPRRPNGEMHCYCPPEMVNDEMGALIDIYRKESPAYPPEVKAAWLHHRFTQIHPFQDGNGRVARALASLVFLSEGLFPLVIRESERTEYINALESADHGDLDPLVLLFAQRQRDAVLKALGLEQQVQQGKYAGAIMRSALKVLADRHKRAQESVNVVYQHAVLLFEKVEQVFRDFQRELDPQLHALTPNRIGSHLEYSARMNCADNESANRHYFKKQISETARDFGYFANFDQHHCWVRLTLTTEQAFDYVVSIHGYGPSASGILAASAFAYTRAPREEGGFEAVNLHPAMTDLFQFNYAEPYDSILSRFTEWLDSANALGLSEWKRSLQ